MASLHYPASKKKFLRKKFLIDKFFEGKEWTRFVVEFFFFWGGRGELAGEKIQKIQVVTI